MIDKQAYRQQHFHHVMIFHLSDRRSRILLAIFPSVALGLLNDFWLAPLYQRSTGWFYLADVTQWVLVPLLVWFFVLRKSHINLKECGLDFTPLRARRFESLGLCLLVIFLLWTTYTAVRGIANRFLWPYAGSFGYGLAASSSPGWHALAVTYFSATAALVEEVVFRGLPWMYLALNSKSHRNFLYVTVPSLIFGLVGIIRG